MHQLATFSIETDTTVLLKYRNGHHRRVLANDVARYVSSPDAEKIKAAFRLRTNFMDTHMPKTKIVLMLMIGAGVLSLAVVTGGSALAHFAHPAGPAPTTSPQLQGISRSMVEPSEQPPSIPNSSSEIARHSATPAPLNKSGRPKKIAMNSSRPSSFDGKLSLTKLTPPTDATLLTPLPTPDGVASETGQVLDAAIGPVPEVTSIPTALVQPTLTPSPLPLVPQVGNLPSN